MKYDLREENKISFCSNTYKIKSNSSIMLLKLLYIYREKQIGDIVTSQQACCR